MKLKVLIQNLRCPEPTCGAINTEVIENNTETVDTEQAFMPSEFICLSCKKHFEITTSVIISIDPIDPDSAKEFVECSACGARKISDGRECISCGGNHFVPAML